MEVLTTNDFYEDWLDFLLYLAEPFNCFGFSRPFYARLSKTYCELLLGPKVYYIFSESAYTTQLKISITQHSPLASSSQ